MKKITVLLFVFVLIFGAKNTFAQSKAEKKIAKKLCDCTKATLKEYPPLFREMILDMADLGEEKAQKKFMAKMMTLSPEEQQAFSSAIEEKPIEKVMEKNCDEAKTFIQKAKMGDSGDKGLEKILNFMKKEKNCKEGYAFMLLGMKK